MFSFIILSSSIGLGQTPQDKEGLLRGEEMGQGTVAEVNGYPEPKRVLDAAEKLQLSDQQKKAITRIYQEAETRAKELSQSIIRLEEELNKAFQDQLVIEKSVRDDAEQIGRLRGRLRGVHLVAHLKTRAVLTEKQIAAYASLQKSKR